MDNEGFDSAKPINRRRTAVVIIAKTNYIPMPLQIEFGTFERYKGIRP
jgi:hypothetical protein